MFLTPQRMSQKYRYALRGMSVAWRRDDSFRVHLPAALVVAAAAWWLRVSLVEGLLLLLCVAAVIAAELFNTALEELAKAISDQRNDAIRDALDISAGGVLTVAVAAKIVGVLVFASRLFGS